MKHKILLLLACLGMMSGACHAQEEIQISLSETEISELSEENQDDNLPDDLPEVDFEKLHAWNPDIYAWLYIPDTVINYPILRSGPDLEEDYYLDHTVDHVEGYPGSIFTELYNSDDFTDVNTVIYGHNMRNGSMFGSLSAYQSLDYMHEHQMIYICTEEGWFTYQIACGVVTDDSHALFEYGFGSYEAFDRFFDALYYDVVYTNECAYDLNRSDYDPLRDTLVTLITCVNGNRPENRFYVVGRLIDGPEDALSRIREQRLELVRRYIEY